MASSEIDQKFLGKLARLVENENPLLSSVLFKILGLSINLSSQLITARKQRRQDGSSANPPLDLHLHIIWLSREGLLLLDQYVLPSATLKKNVELKILAYKLLASFYHIIVLFHNTPPVTTVGTNTPEGQSTTSVANGIDKGKGVAKGNGTYGHGASKSISEGGPVGPPPGFGPQSPTAFLMKSGDYLPLAQQCFKEAIQLAEQHLWGSHSLRLSVKTEYAAFLYECVHDVEASRKLAKETISEVYEATEGIDNDMFNDACELVTVLGKMMKRGLGSNNTLRSKGHGTSNSGSQGTPRIEQTEAQAPVTAPPGMI